MSSGSAEPSDVRMQCRLAEARSDIEVFRQATAAWKASWTGSPALRSHLGHLDVIDEVVGALVGDVERRLDELAAEADGGVLYAELRRLDVPLLYARRLWSWYAEKMETRRGGVDGDEVADAVRSAMLGADEVVWSVWKTVLTALGRTVPLAPLPYLAALETATATPPEQFPQELRPSIDPGLSTMIEAMPIAVIGVPPSCVQRPWMLAVLAHETGHQLEYALAARAELQQAVGVAVMDVAPERADRWKQWTRECFADAVAVVSVGPSILWAIAELEERAQADDLADRASYPPPLTRLALVAHMLSIVGSSTPAWLDGASGILGRAVAAMDDDRDELSRVATALLSFDLGTGSLQSIAGNSLREFQPTGTFSGWRTELAKDRLLDPVPGLDSARLCVAAAVAVAASTPDAAGREGLARRVLAVLPDSREIATRATLDAIDVASVVDAVRLAHAGAVDRVEVP